MPLIDKSFNLHYIDCVFSHLNNFDLYSNYTYFKCFNKYQARIYMYLRKTYTTKYVQKNLFRCLYNITSTIYHMSPSRHLCCYCSIILVLFNWRLVRGTVECKITFQFCGEEGGRTVVKFCLGNQLIFSLRNRCELAIVWQTHQDLLIRLSLTLVQEKQSKLHLCKINTSKIF